jgi:hypothetical protein
MKLHKDAELGTICSKYPTPCKNTLKNNLYLAVSGLFLMGFFPIRINTQQEVM